MKNVKNRFEDEVGTLPEVQLAPFGDWPQTGKDADGNPVEIVQHVTPETMELVAAAFSKDVVVDVDHKSADGTDSKAAAVSLCGTLRPLR